MPLAKITLREDISPDVQRPIADGVHNALVSAVGIPAPDRFQIIERRKAADLIFGVMFPVEMTSAW